MRIGCCFGTNLDYVASLRDAGFDYGEVNIARTMGMDDAEFIAFSEKLKEIGLPIEAGCVFLTGDLLLNRLQRDFAKIDEYLDNTYRRCAALGLQTIVFGSGRSRCIPEGLTAQDVFEDLVVFLREHVVLRSETYGIGIAIEPLSDGSAIRTVHEALALAEAVGSKWVQALADIHHMMRVGDPIDAIRDAKGCMGHAHTSRPRENGRTVPQHGDGFDQLPFLQRIVETGCPRLSIEADTKPETFWDESHDAIVLLRETIRAAEAAL